MSDPVEETSAEQTPEAPSAPEARLAALEGVLGEQRSQSLSYLRRALLAEHAGTLVPELVAGDSPEALEASVQVAHAAFDAARQAALAELERQRAEAPSTAPAVPGGSGAPRDTLDTVPLSPFQRIAAGLRR